MLSQLLKGAETEKDLQRSFRKQPNKSLEISGRSQIVKIASTLLMLPEWILCGADKIFSESNIYKVFKWSM